jgi:ribosomal protein S18 acetylase RimI-like enzyme
MTGWDDVTSAEENYLGAWRLLVEASNGGVVEETDDVVFTVVPAPIAFFNSAFVKPPADPVSCLPAAMSFYRERQKPFTIRFRDSPEAAAACQEAGLVLAGSSPLMNVSTSEMEGPSGVEVRRVDAGSWDDHLSAIAAGFGMPPTLVGGMFGRSLLEAPHYAAFNAYLDGQVASTAALIVTPGVAGIYNVATLEAFRNRGLGAATTRAAVVEGGRRGCPVATLQSSEMGFSVYERMGFRPVATWTSLTSGDP